jgi:hypothetical protein
MRSLGGRRGGFCLPMASLAVFSIASPSQANESTPVVNFGGFTALAVRGAVQGAARRLSRPSCQRLFSEFTDAKGRTLQANLDARGLTPEAQLRGIRFEDGVVRHRCDKSGVHAVTWPGSSIVYICREFLTAHNRNPYLSESYVIHELLHTLGLGENPPSSQQITDRVVAACRN